MLQAPGVDRAVEHLLHHDRQVVVGGLVVVTTLAWVYLFYLASRMNPEAMDAASIGAGMAEMARLAPWTPTDALLMFLMWSIMMVGMMLPSATPMVLLYARVVRHNARQSDPLVPTGAFFTGYVIVWILFSACATVLQWGLEQAALLSPMMVGTSNHFAGGIMLIAAIYQWTPYKNACLSRCRNPVWLLSTYWRDGAGGAMRMGLAHGSYCLGCCWSLMLLLFAGGVMNLLLIAVITIFVLVEKVAPWGRGLGRAGALVLGLAGVVLIIS
jgi:predicted metal-binding membrane protein